MVEVGQKYGKLLVVEDLGYFKTPNNENRRFFKCVCDCGTVVKVNGHLLTNGHKKSCGCLKGEIQRARSIIHNINNPKLLYVWRTMKQRCLVPTCKDYRLYGGRGIRICDEWLNDFFSFNSWAEKNGYKEGLMLDRIDNDGNYEPKNCRWATSVEQANNKRTNVFITLNGETNTLREWCTFINIRYGTVEARLRRGWTIEQAFGIEPYNPPKRILKSRRKKVLQFSMDNVFLREWDSMYNAAEYLGCNPHYIKKTCLGEQKSYAGYIWKYKVD